MPGGRLKIGFGDLNNVSEQKIGRFLDLRNTSIVDVIRESALNVFKKDAFQNTGPMRGIVLRVEVNTNTPESDSWINRVFGDEKVHTLTMVKVRIPEIHAALPEPLNYGRNANNSNKVIDMYPSFIAINKEVSDKPVAPGDIVLVDFGDRVNLTEPVYLGPILSSPAPGVVGEASIKETFDKKNAGTLLALPPLGDNVLGNKNINNQLPQPIENNKKTGVKTMSDILNDLLSSTFHFITEEELKRIMPHVTQDNVNKYLNGLNQAMLRFEINTPQRQAAFLAQIAVESGELKFDTELSSGQQYEGRTNLGNNQKGDGPKYKGRGLIQLTGRYNYTKFNQKLNALGITADLVNNPEQASRPDISTLIAAQYFADHNLNKLADNGDIVGISQAVNGGNIGLDHRTSFYNKALEVLT